jgi:UDP-glucose 4-epimerase
MMEVDWRGRRVLVTGASGFIGQHLCKALVSRGAIVCGVSRQGRADRDGARWFRLDVADHGALGRAFSEARPEIVFHLASEVTGARDRSWVLPVLRSNLVGTVNLLDLAAAHGCRRVVLAGSMEEPGPEGGAPVSPYAASKAASSLYADLFHALFATPVVTARLFMVYGPGQGDATKLVPYLIRKLLDREVPHLSDGTRPVDWIYVADVVEGLLRCAVAPTVVGRSVELGSGQLVTIRALAESIGARVAPDVPLGFGEVPARPFERVRVADRAVAEALLGWRPRTSLDAGLDKTVAYYRDQRAETPHHRPARHASLRDPKCRGGRFEGANGRPCVTS